MLSRENEKTNRSCYVYLEPSRVTFEEHPQIRSSNRVGKLCKEARNSRRNRTRGQAHIDHGGWKGSKRGREQDGDSPRSELGRVDRSDQVRKMQCNNQLLVRTTLSITHDVETPVAGRGLYPATTSTHKDSSKPETKSGHA